MLRDGKNLSGLIAVSWVLNIITLVLGYSRINAEKEWIWVGILDDEIKDGLGVHLMVYLVFLMIMQYHWSVLPLDIKGLKK